MTYFQRFDLDPNVTMPSVEWFRQAMLDFHSQRAIPGVTSHRIRRYIGWILGEETRRYWLSRRIFRLVLRIVHKALGRQLPTDPQRQLPTDPQPALAAITVFPLDYVPITPPKVNYSYPDVAVIPTPFGSTVNALTDTLDALPDSVAWVMFTSSGDPGVASLLREQITANADVVFADEAGRNPLLPTLKAAAVGTHTLLSYNVVGRPALVRLQALREVGGLRPEAGVAYEHDLYLRLSERQAIFQHVPLVLPGGYDGAWFDQPALITDTQTVVEAALARRGWDGSVTPGVLPGLSDWRPSVPPSLPTVDIVIPTRDRIDLVKNCLSAIESVTTYPHWNIIILDNDSTEPASREFFATTRYPVVPCPGPFNYAAIMNRGIRHATADYVLTLNNDTVVLTPDWLEQLLGLASLPDVGIVGACLVDQYGRGEHESVVIAPFPQHLRTWSNYPFVDHFSRATRDVAAVTGAVQLFKRSFYEQLRGMDEELRVTMNDVDLCLRSHNEGKTVIYTPHVRLTHHVSSSRGSLNPFEDRNHFLFRWDVLGSFKDPFFPETLRLYGETMYYRP